MRSLVLRFDDLAAFRRALEKGDQELGFPAASTSDPPHEGEWLLVVFEAGKRSTAAAGWCIGVDEGRPRLAFEQRDWERLVGFAGAASSRNAAVAGEPRQDDDEDEDEDGDEEEEEDEDPTVRETRPPLTEGTRVLVVDDDREMVAVLGAMLEAIGLTVEATETAESALARLAEPAAASIDILVLDWNLPVMSGLDLCRALRKDARHVALPVLFLTANTSSKDLVEAFASGADDYVTKPFRAPELGARIFGLLRRARLSYIPRAS